jgi:ubiquinone/menaquinone biosynthesis C-methylase UbiE
MITSHCRICFENRSSVILPDLLKESGISYSLLRCDSCSFVTIHPIPPAEILEKFYGHSYWSDNKVQMSYLLTLLFKLRMKSIIKEIRDLQPGKSRILDWGAGDGALVNLLRQNGFDCWGIDLYSNQPSDERLASSSIEDVTIPDEFFDIITCFHVLEHLENPVESVKKAFRLIKKGGFLILEVPNISSFGFLLFRKRWQPLEIPTHLNHFNLQSLVRLFDNVGDYEITRISYFSKRVSASSLVLSLFPFFIPRRIRKGRKGKYPPSLMVTYLFLQILAFPIAFIGSVLKRGAVIRVYVKKT